MKKAEILQDLAVYMRDRVDNGFDITITDAEARALAEALEGLRWANIYYTNPQVPGELGVEYEKFADAYQAHTDVKKISLSIPFETVGIIRLKESQDEN